MKSDRSYSKVLGLSSKKLEAIFVINLPNGDIDECFITANNMNTLQVRSVEMINSIIQELEKTFPYVSTTPEGLKKLIMIKKAPEGFRIEFVDTKQVEAEKKDKYVMQLSDRNRNVKYFNIDEKGVTKT